MADNQVYENTYTTQMMESKGMCHLNVSEGNKTWGNQAIHNELVQEQSFTNGDTEITRRYVELPMVASADDENVYEMPLDRCSIDDAYTDVVSVPPKINGGEQNVNINDPSCIGKSASQVIKFIPKQFPPVPCRKNDPSETVKSSFGDLSVARKEQRGKTKTDIRITTKRVVVLVIFIIVVFILLTASVGISFILLTEEMSGKIVKLQTDLDVLKSNSMDGTMSNVLENLTRLDEKVEHLEYKSYIRKEQISNMTTMLDVYQHDLKSIRKVAAIRRFLFDPATLHKAIYMSNDSRTISTQRIPDGRRGIGNGFQNYKGVRGSVYFTNFDIVYFEVLVNYKIINPLNYTLLFEIGFSTAYTIDGSYFVGVQNESCSFACSSYLNGSSIMLFYQQNLGNINFLKTLTVNSPNIAFRGLYGFYVHGPKGEITVIDKISNVLLHRFDNVDFSNNMYPVFAVFGSNSTNTTLTLNTDH